jgi:DNA-directed RNA polymerase specialized sigma24 family protein
MPTSSTGTSDPISEERVCEEVQRPKWDFRDVPVNAPPIEKYGGLFKKIARQITNDRHDIKDICQELSFVYLRAVCKYADPDRKEVEYDKLVKTSLWNWARSALKTRRRSAFVPLDDLIEKSLTAAPAPQRLIPSSDLEQIYEDGTLLSEVRNRIGTGKRLDKWLVVQTVSEILKKDPKEVLDLLVQKSELFKIF